ncbi:hypothetical protein Anas_04245 [Armadillidium nasatum]|uniref:Uncharacterized protein n=1 Tax=Armadillidium nasatum TaxID=96803 RepID=A0A5N5SJT5_9CRUS|nr:hypothetical protein Anas_04245 [Armadillidium nasatum]
MAKNDTSYDKEAFTLVFDPNIDFKDKNVKQNLFYMLYNVIFLQTEGKVLKQLGSLQAGYDIYLIKY